MSENTENTNPTPEELVRNFRVSMQRSTMIPTPVDPTLSNPGEAADAYATGQAIANIAAVKKVNNQSPNAAGEISVNATQIPMTGEAGAQTIAEAMQAAQSTTADAIHRTSENAQTVEDALGEIEDLLTDGIGNDEVDAMFEEEGESE